MAAKLFEPLNDERKQIGCMSGFIHLFEPNHTHLPKRITNSMSLQGNSQLFRGRFEVEQTYPFHQHGLEMRSSRNSNDRLGLCTESSRASCSSSHSSSFSSVDYSKIMHPEPSSYDRILFPESPLLDRSLSHSSSSWRMKQQPFDLDDAVKDMSCGIGEESMVLKHQDTPMPLQAMEVSLESLYALGSPRPCLGFNASLCFEERNASRLVDESKANRYERIELGGCYGQENWGSSTESSMLNSTMRTVASQRPPSIVEKLMGLEAMPGMSFITQNIDNRVVKPGERRDTNLIHKSASPVSTRMPLQVSSSIQRSSRKDSKWKNGELVMKPMSSSRILIEPAPWKQTDVNRTSSKTSVKFQQFSAASSESNVFRALYSKFDGRLKDIEFQRSSKDLKTLKQMLDAVQQGGAWQIEGKALSTDVTRNQNPDVGSDINLKEARRKMHHNVGASMPNGEQESCGKTLKSPIVVMKPLRLVAKSDIAASSVIRSESGVPRLSKPQVSDSASRRRALSNTRALKGPNQQNGYQKPQINPSEKKLTRKQPTMRPPATKEKKRNSAVSVVSASPRIQPKNYVLEKKPRPATTTSHAAAKPSVAKSNHPRKSCSSGEKSQPKHSVTQQQCNNTQQSGFSTESKDTCGEDDSEVTSKLRLDHIDGSRISPTRKVARPMFSGIKKHKPSRISTEDTLLTNPSAIGTEQPSPVSVLDSTALRDGPSSPLIRNTASRGTAELVTHMSRQKLKQIEELVHKLNGVSSIDENSNADFIASLCKTTNPDQRYISKILLASGFLFRDFESSGSDTFHPHSSGHVINPELFFVLEQTKSSAPLTKDHRKLSASKSHRRLIFDSCNEILAEHLVPSSTPRKLARRKFSARRLLNDVCDRIDHLQGKNTQECKKEHHEEGQDEDNMLKRIVYKDMILKSDKWGNSEECTDEVVLDIERMLFKDLVKEIVNDEVVLFGLRGRAGRSCDRKPHF